MNIDISKFETCHILVVGDLMIDEYLWGVVDRISPEAPVQVVSVDREEFTLGGSGNVINNLVSLGARVSAAGVIGTGPNGKRLLRELTRLGAETEGIIAEKNRTTTKKTRIIAAQQQVLRIDREIKNDVLKKTRNAIVKAAVRMIPDVDVVLISDCGKGLVSTELITKLTARARKHGKWTIVDPKGFDFSKYAGASVITPNKKEASLAAGVEIVDQKTLFEAGRRLLKTTAVEKLLITCGKDGMVVFEAGRKPRKISTRARQVYDVSGAGDTVLAFLGLAWAAGIVVAKVGTATVSRKELNEALKLTRGDTPSKYIDLKALPQVCNDLRKKSKRTILTNGCFDVLHIGHVQLLSASKQLGDVLIVAVDDDDSVRRLKGPQRPVISSNERLRILSALDSVDHVILFSCGELNKIIKAAQPDVLTKGSDYTVSKVQGRKIVERHGGRVEIIPITDNISSTQVINNIRNK
jgi:D-beta-D-heptose 7-phosphate kinase/D-beta-D-heptose 1-phosphate adenosyltransferase